jgi:hypothetical protein
MMLAMMEEEPMTVTIETSLAPNDTHSLSTHSLQAIKPIARLMVYELYGTDCIPLRPILGKEGNKKIPNTTAIFNMASAHKCPAKKLGLCKAAKAGVKCYALKSEVGSRPYTQPYRERQMDFWLKTSAQEFALQFLLINALRKKTHTFNALRFNEAGDFHSQECVDKAEKIARILKPYGIVCYCYTSRDDLDYHRVEALRISGSGFKKDGVVNVFQIIESKEDKPKGYGLCPMDCRSCTRCLKAGMKTAALKH